LSYVIIIIIIIISVSIPVSQVVRWRPRSPAMTGRSERRPGDLIDNRGITNLTLAITSGQTSAISVFGRTGVRGRANVRSRDRPGSKQRAPAAGASTASAVIMAMSVQCAASLTETSRLRRCCTTDHTDRVACIWCYCRQPSRAVA